MYKDESSSFIHLPKLQWTSELIIAVICAGRLVHLLGGLWGWLGGRKHKREAPAKDHAVAVAKLKEEHARDMGDYVTKGARHEVIIRNLKEQLNGLKADSARKMNELTTKHVEEVRKHEA